MQNIFIFNRRLPSGLVDGAESARISISTVTTTWQRLKNRCWNRFDCKKQKKVTKNRLGRCSCNCWPKMRCFTYKQDPKIQLWSNKQSKGISTMQLNAEQRKKPLSRWNKFINACRYFLNSILPCIIILFSSTNLTTNVSFFKFKRY
jgi:hypothetical protein